MSLTRVVSSSWIVAFAMNPTRRAFVQMLAAGAAGTSAGLPKSNANSGDEICFMSARALARLIRTRKFSAREVMSAHLRHIERLNPRSERDRSEARRRSLSRAPAISVPAGLTPEGLPVGIQIVGRYRNDLGVLQIAHAFEGATGIGRKRPAIAMSRPS